MAGRASYDDATKILAAERDVHLALSSAEWPSAPLDGWDSSGHVLQRIIRADRRRPKRLPVPLEELILRFPSAPMDSLQRLNLHHRQLKVSESFHTIRVLRAAASQRDRERPAKRTRRIFLMHTGLNERGKMGLYYRLAGYLIQRDPRTVCVVHPFPGHMTRFPFEGPAQTPMDQYLWDGSHLFRQFLRFMIETQWFLSAIVRRSSYRCASGANLLAECDAVNGSRLDADALAAAILRAWNSLAKASSATTKAEQGKRRNGALGLTRQRTPPTQGQLVEAIETLRDALHLDDYERLGGELTAAEQQPGLTDERTEPDVHVLGYSLGGFTAQSVFMSWPFLISSCSSVLAGGTLRELAPTSFTDPEEWQTVLHSLRYELDDRLMNPHLKVTTTTVAGIDRELFNYFKRTFYEVFQQDYPGSIRTRLEAFRDRMLFIVGGDDPVVRPESVLKAGPRGGINLLEIGGLGHFFDDGARKRDSEGRQRRRKARQPTPWDEPKSQHQTFWLPEMASLVHRFSDNAADEQRRLRPFVWFDASLSRPQRSRQQWNKHLGRSSPNKRDQIGVRPLSQTELIEIEHDGALPGEVFERCLDDLLVRAQSKGDGVLFILRNEIPTVLLHDATVRESAAALFHDDFSIVRYCHGIDARREQIDQAIARICLVLPWNAGTIARQMDLQRAYPSQAESAGGHVMTRLSPEKAWQEALKNCRTLAKKPGGELSIRRFDGNEPLPDASAGSDPKLVGLAEKLVGAERRVPSLPDCWVWVGRSQLVHEDYGGNLDIQDGIDGLARAAPGLYYSEDEILRAIQKETIRIVDVSRARYNPRFRGRLLLDPRTAQRRIAHVALCLAMSDPIGTLKNGADPFE